MDTNGYRYVGGLAGVNGGTISDSSATGTIDGLYLDVGGLVGWNINSGIISSSYALTTISESSAQYVGGLVGLNDGSVTQSAASGSVFGGYYVGGLAGSNSGTIDHSYSDTDVPGGALDIGGLVGLNTGTIQFDYATGAVSGYSAIGGLVGRNEGSVAFSYATGAALGGQFVGGLDGQDVGGTVSDSYATGAATGGYVGALVGAAFTGTTIERSFAIGEVTATNSAGGGLLGYNQSATVIDSYWDTQTTGWSTSAGGTGMTTAQLQGSLPSGFSGAVWGTGSGLYPYLLWRYPSTPQFISGTGPASTGAGIMTVAGLIDGSDVGVTATTGANGYYYLLLPAGTLTGTQQLMMYLLGGTIKANAYLQSVGGDTTGADLTANTLTIVSDAANVSTMLSGVATAQGSHTGSDFLYSGGSLASGASLLFDSTNAGGLSVDTTVNAPPGTVTLDTAGPVTQTAAGQIVAGALSGNVTGAVTLTGFNKFTNLGAFTATNGLSITDAGSMTVSGAVNVSGASAVLRTTGSGHAITINAPVSNPGHTIQLYSAGDIAQGSSGILNAPVLYVTAAGNVALTAANQLPAVSGFTAAGNFSFADGTSLRFTGPVTVPGTLTLNITGSIDQNSGAIITTPYLTGSATGYVALNAGNKINNLNGFLTGNYFSLSDAQSLAVIGALNVASNIVSLTTTGSGSNLTLAAPINDAGHSVKLYSAGTITQTSGGAITAAAITGTSAGNTALTASNHVAALASFASSGSFSLFDAQALTVNGALSATGGDALLETTAGAISITAPITSSYSLKLFSAAGISQNSLGPITAAGLSGSSGGNTALTASNLIPLLKGFTSSGTFSLIDAQSLGVNGALSTTGDALLMTTGAGHSIALNAAVGTNGGTLKLNSAGDINQSAAGIITSSKLMGSSGGATRLTAANQLSYLLAFTAGNGFTLNDAQTLSVIGALSVTGCCVTLTTTNGGNLLLSGAIGDPSHTVTLNAAGYILQASSGVITAGALTGSSGGNTTLTGANQIPVLNTFTSAGGFSLTDAQTLAVNAQLSVTGCCATLTTTGSGHDIVLHAPIVNSGHTVKLYSAGAISQTSAGPITAAGLLGTSVGSVSLIAAANHIASLLDFSVSAGNFTLVDGQQLLVDGNVRDTASTGTISLGTNAGDLNISGNGILAAATVTLNTAGEAWENSVGEINTNLLNVTANTGIYLVGNNNINAIGTRHTNSGPNVINQ